MILKGSQRSSALKLATHLLNGRDNDHVEVHELRGFSVDDLRGALREVDAIAKGTKCQQSLFCLSFNPPETERVSVDQFEAAIEKAEIALGLCGQARAIVFHEKEGRRHAHVVWSRIDVEKMTAIHMSFYKTRLNAVSKELFLEHGWRMPDGYRDKTKRNPLSYAIDQWQQAKRTKQDPEALKMIFRECWSVSDNRASFAQALEEQGFILAQGKRGHVAVDFHGEVYAISRQTSEKAKAVRDKLGEIKDLPTVTQAKDLIASRMTDKLKGLIREARELADAEEQEIQRRRTALKDRQRQQRQQIIDRQEQRAQAEAVVRAKRFRTGIRGVWDWLSGKTRKIKKQNEKEAAEAACRDAAERERIVAAQLSERRVLQQHLRKTKRDARQRAEDLRHDVAIYLGMREATAGENNDTRSNSRRPRKFSRPQFKPER